MVDVQLGDKTAALSDSLKSPPPLTALFHMLCSVQAEHQETDIGRQGTEEDAAKVCIFEATARPW